MLRWLPIVVGLVVGVVSAFLAFGLFVGATWSSMHSGGSRLSGELTMLGFQLLAFVAPVALAFVAGWLTWRALGLSDNPDEANDLNSGI
jgi:hypothetical protein